MSPSFDEPRYRELLEGLEISEILYSNLNDERRVDSEFFSKENLLLLAQLKSVGTRTFGDFAFVTDGIHTSIDYSETSGINLLSATSPRENYFDTSRGVFISKDAHWANPRTALNEGDVIISTVGTIGNCAVVTPEVLPANSDRHVGIIRCDNSILPNYVSTFMVSKFGRFQSLRESTGNVQLNLFLYKIRKLLIADLSDTFQTAIDTVVKQAHLLRTNSKIAYSQAESLLLSALNLTDYTPDRSNTNIKSFSESYGSSGRLDAEYYQPKYDELEQLIQSNGVYWKRISEIEEYNARGCQPEYYEGGKLNVINSKHILEDHLDYDNFEKTNEIFWTLQPKARVQADDILVYTTGANIGRSNIYQSNEKAMASNHVNILRIRDEDPFYVSFVMNSFIGRMQTDKLSAGSAQAELYPKDISQFMIPFVEKSIQQKIRENIIESLALKHHSSQLLETAKRAVEIAIEESESSALAFIGERGR